MNNHKIILQFLESLRNSYDNCEEVYTKGGCYQLYLILKSLYPNAICWYSIIEGHVYTEINGKFYDIKGDHIQDIRWIKIEEEPNIEKQAKNWRYERNN